MSRRPRVLVVDDSAFARKVLREVLSGDERIDVVGFARDGLDALEKIEELAPDVITLDLVMPGLDGPGVLEALRLHPDPPRVVVVTMTDTASPIAVAALQAGAFDLVHKPTGLATDRLYELRDELVRKVLLAAAGTPPLRLAAGAPIAPDSASGQVHTRIVVLGTSTGGPRALTLLVSSLPRSFQAPMAAVVHMPTGFTQSLAQRLDDDSEVDVSEAREGALLAPGSVTIARAGFHMRVIDDGGTCGVTLAGPTSGDVHCPSADVLFASAAAAFGDRVLAVVLTGMGTDGLEGSRAVRAAGGRVLVEHASTCVVHGMPRAVEEAGLADAVVPLDGMARAVLSRL